MDHTLKLKSPWLGLLWYVQIILMTPSGWQKNARSYTDLEIVLRFERSYLYMNSNDEFALTSYHVAGVDSYETELLHHVRLNYV